MRNSLVNIALVALLGIAGWMIKDAIADAAWKASMESQHQAQEKRIEALERQIRRVHPDSKR